MGIENPMVRDSLWVDQEKGPKVIGECAGCHEDIDENEDYLDCTSLNVLIHQNSECSYQFVAEMSICKCAEDK